MNESNSSTVNSPSRSHRIRRLNYDAEPIADYRHTKELISGLTSALKAKDEYTFHHSRRVANIAALLASAMNLPAEAIGRLHLGGLLHDIGKLGIHDSILKKSESLSDAEFEDIKGHPEIGCDILSGIESLASVLPIVRHHHERIDGRGYPDQLLGNEIPLEARILAVADSFDAMTSDRSYRDGKSVEKAIATLQQGAGKQWDAQIVHLLVDMKMEIAAACGVQVHKPIPHFQSRTKNDSIARPKFISKTAESIAKNTTDRINELHKDPTTE